MPLEALEIWDIILHSIILTLLACGLVYLSMDLRRSKNSRMSQDESDDLKKILGSLPLGAALTVDFVKKEKLARRSAAQNTASRGHRIDGHGREVTES